MNLNLTLTSDSIFNHPDFEKIVSQGNITFKVASYETLVCEDFGIRKQIDFPVAAIESFKKKSDPSNFILKATPCYFSLQKDHYRFEKNIENDILKIDLEDLCNKLNKNFSNNHQSFFVESNKLFFQSSKNINIATYFPGEINQIEERKFLPYGQDALKWHSFINELQMFLYSDPVNKKREQNNQLPINTIWFSGGGTFPEKIKSPLTGLAITNSNLINKLSESTNTFKVQEFNSSAKNPFSNAQYIYYELPYDDKKNDELLTAISSSFNNGIIKQLIIRICIGHVCLLTEVTRLTKLKFWKREVSLIKLFNEYY
mgnify:FL=1